LSRACAEGPPAADVTLVEVERAPRDDTLTGFDMRR
jgi:hypothetical protein